MELKNLKNRYSTFIKLFEYRNKKLVMSHDRVGSLLEY